MIEKLIAETRSFRRFLQNPRAGMDVLEHLVAMARLAPSAGNNQPLKYIIVSEPAKCAEVLKTLVWAGHMPEWPGPSAEEAPTGYVIICADPRINPSCDIDIGLAAQNILLAAREKGYGGCLLGSIDMERLRQSLNIPEPLVAKLVVALGAPGEQVVLETVGRDGDIRYWRDDKSVHHVPKRAIEDLIAGRF